MLLNPRVVDDWSADWLAIKRDLKDFLEQANAGQWDQAKLSAEHIQAMAARLSDYAKRKSVA